MMPWTWVVTLIIAIFGVIFGALRVSDPPFIFIRGLLALAALLLAGKTVWWVSTEIQSKWGRVLIPAIIGAVALCLLSESMRWINRIEENMSVVRNENNGVLDGRGGDGGDGNAAGKGSVVIHGQGGPGGGPGGGRGGKGGGGDAIGEGSLSITGDGGGGGGRPDGRGGIGAQSALRRVPPEILKNFGLTGNENYGAGGSSPNSPEHDRRLSVLKTLSAEYMEKNPEAKLVSMPDILMPPFIWINERLSQKSETFRVDSLDDGKDFFLRDLDSKKERR